MGIKQYLREITLSIMFLQEQMDKIGDYPDKSLFFQHPQIIEGWVKLVSATEKIKLVYDPESVKEWLQRTDTYVSYLLSMRRLNLLFRRLEMDYLEQMKNLINFYDDWEDRECISDDVIETLSGRQYLGVLKKDITQNYSELNSKLLKARSDEFSVLMDINNFLLAVMNQVGQNVMNLNPNFEDFAKAIDNDLKGWTKNFGTKMFREMKEDLNRNYKVHRTDHNTIELWSDMLDADEKALNKAKMQQLSEYDEPRQEHWGEDMKKQMDENGRLMQQILSSCHTEELLDFGNAEIVELFIPLLTPDNLDMFYEIIVRRSLIQCEMFPELKEQHEAWLNDVNELSDENNETGMDAVRQSRLNEIISILQKGDWKEPATADNIIQLLNAIFGKDTSLLDEEDVDKCEKMWALVEGGGGDRMVIVPANLAGFFKEENLLKGSPKEISNALFDNGNQVNNINKGNSNRCSNDFDAVIPFLKKYIDKIIRQV